MAVVQTKHYQERKTRQMAMYEIGYGEPYKSFKVDRGHKDGAEIHVVMTSGIIMIFNAKTMRHITDLIARPGQLRRYGIEDEKLLELARQHEEAGLNLL